MIYYKLTDENGETKYNTKWEMGTTHEVSGSPKLCSNTVLHAYTSPLLAELMNPVHARFNRPICYTVEGDACISDGIKVGCQKLTVVGTSRLPEISTKQRVVFGILTAMEFYKNEDFLVWAENWLNGKDRSPQSAKETLEIVRESKNRLRYASVEYASVEYAIQATISFAYLGFNEEYTPEYISDSKTTIAEFAAHAVDLTAKIVLKIAEFAKFAESAAFIDDESAAFIDYESAALIDSVFASFIDSAFTRFAEFAASTGFAAFQKINFQKLAEKAMTY
jgi:hypothetical protein